MRMALPTMLRGNAYSVMLDIISLGAYFVLVHGHVWSLFL